MSHLTIVFVVLLVVDSSGGSDVVEVVFMEQSLSRICLMTHMPKRSSHLYGLRVAKCVPMRLVQLQLQLQLKRDM